MNAQLAQAALKDPELRPYIEQQVKQERVRLSYREASGVRFSGMQALPGEMPEARSTDEILRDAQAEQARDLAWKASPRGRLHAVIADLCEMQQPEGYALLRIWDQRLNTLSVAPDTDAVIRAIRILNSINTAEARKGVQALCEMAVPLKDAA